MKKIFGFVNSGTPGMLEALAISEDGKVLAGHCCSSECYVPHDLGVTGDWKHDKYDAEFGQGNWTIEYVPMRDITTHAGLQEAIARANSLGDEAFDDAELPSVQITFE